MESLTEYKAVESTASKRYGHVTTVDLWPHTGRMHQLRRHLSGFRYPILGDRRYTPPDQHKEGKMFLWAVEISFPHPGICSMNRDNEDDAGGSAAASDGGEHQSSKLITIKIPEPVCFDEERQAQM